MTLIEKRLSAILELRAQIAAKDRLFISLITSSLDVALPDKELLTLARKLVATHVQDIDVLLRAFEVQYPL